ncbi:MAG: hypothetical protein Q9227_008545 [Pyrenula ochraceoflavens]
MRITVFVISYSVISLAGVIAPESWIYLQPWIDFAESIALASFFLLLCEYVSPHEDRRASFFAALEVKDRKGRVKEASALNVYRKWWIAIFQFPVVTFVCAIATDITQAANIYCEGSLKPHFANLWILIVKSVSVSVAVIAVLKMYGMMKAQFGHHKPLAKLAAFKGIISLNFLEQIIFAILNNTSVMDPTNKLTYADFHVGIPNLCNCIQMAIFSIFFHYAYTFRPYVIREGENVIKHGNNTYTPTKRYQGGFLGLRGVLGSLNPMEVGDGLIFAFTMAGSYQRLKKGGANGGGGFLYKDDSGSGRSMLGGGAENEFGMRSSEHRSPSPLPPARSPYAPGQSVPVPYGGAGQYGAPAPAPYGGAGGMR